MPSGSRLTHAEIERLARIPGQRINGNLFSIRATPLPKGRVRAAFVVSKKVSLKAVVRNRIKRRCRAALAPLVADIERPLALIVTARREAASASFADIRQDIERLIQRVR